MNDLILVYSPGCNHPQRIATKNILKTVQSICEVIECVSIRSLHNILPGAVFLCDENFLAKPDYQVNEIGTILYDYDHYKILGPICIVKCVSCNEGYTFHGLSNDEANLAINGINALLELHKNTSKVYSYQKYLNNPEVEKSIVQSYVLQFVQTAIHKKVDIKNESSYIEFLDISDLDWILQEVSENCVPIDDHSIEQSVIIRCQQIIRYAWTVALSILEGGISKCH